MKLAEALMIRADDQKKLEQLKSRLIRNAKTQEGQRPAENPDELLAEVERLTAELTSYVQRINRTNSATAFDATTSIADALALRDVLQFRSGVYRDVAQAATVVQDARTRSEVRYQGTVDVQAMQQQADALSRGFRELDAKIQELNWTTDLLD